MYYRVINNTAKYSIFHLLYNKPVSFNWTLMYNEWRVLQVVWSCALLIYSTFFASLTQSQHLKNNHCRKPATRTGITMHLSYSHRCDSIQASTKTTQQKLWRKKHSSQGNSYVVAEATELPVTSWHRNTPQLLRHGTSAGTITAGVVAP